MCNFSSSTVSNFTNEVIRRILSPFRHAYDTIKCWLNDFLTSWRESSFHSTWDPLRSCGYLLDQRFLLLRTRPRRIHSPQILIGYLMLQSLLQDSPKRHLAALLEPFHLTWLSEYQERFYWFVTFFWFLYSAKTSSSLLTVSQCMRLWNKGTAAPQW